MRPAAAGASEPESIGDALDRVRWDYDSEATVVSPLVPTLRFFRDFPWQGDGGEADDEAPSAQPTPGPESATPP